MKKQKKVSKRVIKNAIKSLSFYNNVLKNAQYNVLILSSFLTSQGVSND